MALPLLRFRRALSLSSSLLHSTPLQRRNPISSTPSYLLSIPASVPTIPSPSFSHSTRMFTATTTLFRKTFDPETDEIGPDTILFEGCDYNHWLITVDFPKDANLTREQMIDTYVNIAAQIFGSVEEAKKKIYALSTTTYQGFQVECSEETSEKFKSIPGVVFVLPDSYIDPVNKEYGGDKYVNGQIFPRPPPVHYGRRSNRDRNSRDQNYRPSDARNYGPPSQLNYRPSSQQNYGPPPQQNYGPPPPQPNYGPPPPQPNYGPPPPQPNYGPPPPQPNYGPPPPQPNYGPPPPQPNYGQPPPQPNYGQPPPQQNYGPPPPQQNYGPPQQQNDRSPTQQLNRPPHQNHGQPPQWPSYGSPQQSYGQQPRQSYGPPHPPQQSHDNLSNYTTRPSSSVSGQRNFQQLTVQSDASPEQGGFPQPANHGSAQDGGVEQVPDRQRNFASMQNN